MASITSTARAVTYTLTLSEEEARVLRAVMGSITGDPDGPRKHASAIWDALATADVQPLGYLVGSELRG